jgi:hypothetical protein
MTPEGPKRHEITAEPVTIGRHKDNLVVIDDDHASRFHCVVEPVKGGYRVRDLDSKNGTKLNEDKITQAPLAPGDVIRIGALAIHFVDDAAANTADSPLKQARTVKDALHPESHKPIKRTSVKDRRDEPRKPKQPQGGSILDAPMSTGGNNPFDDLAGIESEGSGAPVPLAGDEGNGEVSLAAAAECISQFSAMMDSIDADNLTESDIQLVNSRGEVVHAGTSRKSKKGDVDEAGEGARVLKMLVLTCIRTKATDVHVEPKEAEALVRLRVDGMMVEAMRLAADRDAVARQYATGFGDVLARRAPRLMTLVEQGLGVDLAVARLHLEQMAHEPDSLIRRKAGEKVAAEARDRAARVVELDWPRTPASENAWHEFDAWLRADGRRRNPGTTADLVTAALFAALRDHNLDYPLPWSSMLPW